MVRWRVVGGRERLEMTSSGIQEHVCKEECCNLDATALKGNAFHEVAASLVHSTWEAEHRNFKIADSEPLQTAP